MEDGRTKNWWMMIHCWHGEAHEEYRCHAVAVICFQHCEGPKSLPSPPVTSPFLLSHSLSLPSFSPPIRSSPLNPARGSGERCKLPQWGLGQSPIRQRFWCILRVKKRCWWHLRCTVSNNRKRLFLTFLWRNFPRANYCFHSVVTLLWGSKP